MTLQVLIADDHEVVRRGMVNLLREEYDEIDISEASNGREVVEYLASSKTDLILLDILMPDTNVVDLLAEIRQRDAIVPILILTAASETEFAVRTLKAGANGYITKRHASDQLIAAVRQVLAGEIYLSSAAADAVAAGLRCGSSSMPHESLSRRELEVFLLIAEGKTVKQIAYELSLSDKTVGTYITRIREKTGLLTYVEIARYAIHHHLVS